MRIHDLYTKNIANKIDSVADGSIRFSKTHLVNNKYSGQMF